jgi:hypothetical protein
MRFVLLFVALLWAHLRTSRKRGSHNEKTHGSWSPNNPFESKRAGKRQIIPGIDDPFEDDEDDPFAEDYYGEDDEDADPGAAARERYEAKVLRELERAERSQVYGAVMEAGGLQTRDDLRDEYSEIPNTFKRRDGLPGDEMAEYLATYFPEYGIEDERDLIDFLVA